MMKKILILGIAAIMTINVYASGWMFVKAKETNVYSFIDSTEFNDATMFNHNSISYIADFGTKLKDYCFIRDRVIDLCANIGFANLKSNAKDYVGIYCATDMMALIGYYMTQGMSQFDATKFYLIARDKQITNSAECYCQRLKDPEIFVNLMLFLGQSQALTFNDAVRNFKSDLCEVALLGTEYGDDRDGIMDYIMSTGSYADGGLKTFTMSADMVAIYGSQDAARLALASAIKYIIIDKSLAE